VGATLAASHKVDKIAFTGSTAVGKSIMQAASGNLKKISLELGGKSPNVVFADANIDAAVGGSFFGIFLNTGQVCQAGSRLLVQESVKDEFLTKLKAFTATIKVGDPADPSTTMGPVINESQLAKVVGYVEAGANDGAEMICGGGRLTGGAYDHGLFVQPTIFDGVRNDMKIAREEIFGPVLSVITFKDAAEALSIANDNMYGLAAAVWTKNIDTAFWMAKGLQAGTVWVNSYHSAGMPFMPYGGYKQSGIGRELGHEGLEEYMETKAIQIKLN
jgi:aldehyde dehydrogenase (NAD+)/betaine-aldehyde dehydrogenase